MHLCAAHRLRKRDEQLARMPLRLGAPEALPWYSSTLFNPAAPTERPLGPGLLPLPGSIRVSRLAGCYAVTVVAGMDPAVVISRAMASGHAERGAFLVLLVLR